MLGWVELNEVLEALRGEVVVLLSEEGVRLGCLQAGATLVSARESGRRKRRKDEPSRSWTWLSIELEEDATGCSCCCCWGLGAAFERPVFFERAIVEVREGQGTQSASPKSRVPSCFRTLSTF